MKAGVASRTAELVCTGRAVAHGAILPGRFSDPIAVELLSAPARERVAQARAEHEPAGLRARAVRAYMRKQAAAMAVRTVAIDDAIREANAPQLVILGAGLDARAWRMSELQDAVVFEVDHPATQRDKQVRVAGHAQTAREVRFVPVDLARDQLGTELDRAGHDPSRATTWVWEGVVMYLTRADVEATLRVLAKRSAPRSRLVVLYHRPALLLRAIGPVLRVIGEPLRSSFTPDAMCALLARHGYAVVRDQDLPALAAALSAELGANPTSLGHMRVVVADRAGG